MTTELIHKVLSNNATESERQTLEDWLSADVENQTEFNNVRLLWTQLSHDSNPAGFEKIKNLIRERARSRKRENLIKSCLVLAVVLVVAFLTIVNLHVRQQNNPAYLRFENATLSSVINDLEKHYSIKIEVETLTVLSCTFTGTFYKSQSSNEIIDIIASAASLTLEPKNGLIYKLKGEGCQAIQTISQ